MCTSSFELPLNTQINSSISTKTRQPNIKAIFLFERSISQFPPNSSVLSQHHSTFSPWNEATFKDPPVRQYLQVNYSFEAQDNLFVTYFWRQREFNHAISMTCKIKMWFCIIHGGWARSVWYRINWNCRNIIGHAIQRLCSIVRYVALYCTNLTWEF